MRKKLIKLLPVLNLNKGGSGSTSATCILRLELISSSDSEPSLDVTAWSQWGPISALDFPALLVFREWITTAKRPKFGNGPELRQLFSDDIFPGKTVINTVTKVNCCSFKKNYRDIQMHWYDMYQFCLLNKKVSMLGIAKWKHLHL